MDEATLEAVKQLIKDSLTVTIDVGPSWDYSGGHRAEVTLYLDGEKISSDTCSVNLDN